MKKRTMMLIISIVALLLSWIAFLYLPELHVITLTSLGGGGEPRFLDNDRILLSDSGLEIRDLSGTRMEFIGELEGEQGGYQWLHPDEILYRIRVDPPKGFENGFQFWLFNVETQEASPLTTKVFSGSPSEQYIAISPSKTKIAFPMRIEDSGSINQKVLIHIMDLKTLEVSTIEPPNEKYCQEPEWSPDGKKIIYTCRASNISIRNPISEHVWLTDLSTNQSERLTERLTDYRRFSWSPNNEWVAFIHNFSIWLAPVKNGIPDLDTAYHLRIRDEVNRNTRFANQDFYFSPPGNVSWSPDNNYIVVAGNLYGRDKYEVWVAELE